MDTYGISSDAVKHLFERVTRVTQAAFASAAAAWQDDARNQKANASQRGERTGHQQMDAEVVPPSEPDTAEARSNVGTSVRTDAVARCSASTPVHAGDAPAKSAAGKSDGSVASSAKPAVPDAASQTLRDLLHEPCCMPEVDHLTPAGKHAFTQLIDGLFAGKKYLTVLDAGKDDVESAYLAIRHTVPEAFWIEGCTLLSTAKTSRTWVVQPQVRCTADEALRTLQEMGHRSASLLEALRALPSVEQRVQAAHHALILNARYRDTDAPSEHTAEGPLIRGEASCLGFALAFKYLLDRLDIPCAVVCGESVDAVHSDVEPSLHAWNLVGIKGAWTHVDVSGDAELSHDVTHPRVDFLGLTDYDLARSHRWRDDVYPPALYPLECYRRQGRYVRDWDEVAGLLDLTLQRDGRCVFQMDDRLVAPEDVPEDAPASGECDAPGLPASIREIYQLAAQAVTVAPDEQRTLSVTCNTPLRVVEVTLR